MSQQSVHFITELTLIAAERAGRKHAKLKGGKKTGWCLHMGHVVMHEDYLRSALW